MTFTCPQFNAGRRFTAENFSDAAARVTNHFTGRGARRNGWHRMDSRSENGTARYYEATRGVWSPKDRSTRVDGTLHFSLHAV